jgi:hypothetical protein
MIGNFDQSKNIIFCLGENISKYIESRIKTARQFATVQESMLWFENISSEKIAILTQNVLRQNRSK